MIPFGHRYVQNIQFNEQPDNYGSWDHRKKNIYVILTECKRYPNTLFLSRIIKTSTLYGFSYLNNSERYCIREANILIYQLRRTFPMWILLSASVFKSHQNVNLRCQRDVTITQINEPIVTKGNSYVTITSICVYVIINILCLTCVKVWLH